MFAPVTLITAPAGYGKTTLARQWVAARRAPSIWISATNEHNSGRALLERLWNGLDQYAARDTTLPPNLSVEAVQNRLGALAGPLTVIIDDFQAIVDEAVLATFEQLINGLPLNAHLIVISRRLPNLPLARLRAYGLLRQITYADLAFTLDEVRRALADHDLNQDQLYALLERTEGWVTAIQLTLMSIDQDRADISAQIGRAIDEMHANRYLEAFIIEEVIEALPDDLRQFLLDTVVLDRLDPELCDAVLGIEGSYARIRQLVDGNLFVGRSDQTDPTYRYHALFADVVQRHRARLNPSPPPEELLLRASQWYEHRGNLDLAAEYAVWAKSWDRAASLIKSIVALDADHAFVTKGLELIRQFPKSTMHSDPEFLNASIVALMESGRVNDLREFIDVFARLDVPSLPPMLQGRHALQRAACAETEGDADAMALHLFRALALLPPEDTLSRTFAWTRLFRAANDRGDFALAEFALHQAEAIPKRLGESSPLAQMIIMPEFTNALAISGEFKLAERLIRHQIGRLPKPIAEIRGHLRTRLISILVEQHRLDEAAMEAGMLLREMERYNHRKWFPDAQRALASLYSQQGQPDRALALLEDGLSKVREIGGSALKHRIEASIMQLWLQTGKRELARRWWSRWDAPVRFTRLFGDVQPYAIQLHFLVHDHQYEEAKAVIAEALATARRLRHLPAEIECLVWAAIVTQRQDDEEAMRTHLGNALTLGAPGGFHRVYFAAGGDLRDVIKDLAPQLSGLTKRHALELAGVAATDNREPAATRGVSKDSPF